MCPDFCASSVIARAGYASFVIAIPDRFIRHCEGTLVPEAISKSGIASYFGFAQYEVLSFCRPSASLGTTLSLPKCRRASSLTSFAPRNDENANCDTV